MDSKILVRETRILTEDEIIDISITRVKESLQIPHGIKYSFNYRIRASSSRWRSVIRVDNAHVIKGHKKRDHKHLFGSQPVEFEFISLKKIYEEILNLIKLNRGLIDEIKRH
ncbi:toxin-antitoxin system TumE family protein [Methanosarcina sp.]|uniref:toxin-antitoxin system TumE family protein n=1 Tax=Methanosarcina sp. TaxID=2213 RepID=UPI003C727D88